MRMVFNNISSYTEICVIIINQVQSIKVSLANRNSVVYRISYFKHTNTLNGGNTMDFCIR